MPFELALPKSSRCQQLLFQFLVRVVVSTSLSSAVAVPRVAEADSALQARSEVEKVAYFYRWFNETVTHSSTALLYGPESV